MADNIPLVISRPTKISPWDRVGYSISNYELPLSKVCTRNGI